MIDARQLQKVKLGRIRSTLQLLADEIWETGTDGDKGAVEKWSVVANWLAQQVDGLVCEIEDQELVTP